MYINGNTRSVISSKKRPWQYQKRPNPVGPYIPTDPTKIATFDTSTQHGKAPESGFLFQATRFSFSVATLLQIFLDSDKKIPFWDCFHFSFGKFQILSNGVPHINQETKKFNPLNTGTVAQVSDHFYHHK